MAIYKEGFSLWRTIETQSKQIFNDSCDWGALTKIGDPIWNAAKQLADWYGNKETKNVHRYFTGSSTEIEIDLLDEGAVSDERMSYSEAKIKLRLHYVTCKSIKGYDGFVYIEKLK